MTPQCGWTSVWPVEEEKGGKTPKCSRTTRRASRSSNMFSLSTLVGGVGAPRRPNCMAQHLQRSRKERDLH